METLTLNDGTVYQGSAFESESGLWVYVHHSSITELFPVLSDSSKTSSIIYDSFGTKTTFTGFTHLHWMKEEDMDMISIGLKKQ